MIQKQLSINNLSQVGEAIDKELGAKMVKNFNDSFPTEVKSYYIGREIIQQILDQPNCVGIRFYNALNEVGSKTLVYVGIDENNEILNKVTSVNISGDIVRKEGIVADRVRTEPTSDPLISDWWG